MSQIDGISEETVARLGLLIYKAAEGNQDIHAPEDLTRMNCEWIITALLASGEVVCRKDVEELVEAVEQVLDDMDCFDVADSGDEYILKDNTNNKNQSCCIQARDDLIAAYANFTTKLENV